MLLTPTEIERLTLFNAAELARRHRARGIRLSQPEAVALICDEIMMGARQGRSVAELVGYGRTLLTTDDVLPGVAHLIDKIQIEGMFADGAKMVTIHRPITPGVNPPSGNIPGEIITAEGEIELNAGRKRVTFLVTNTADRPIQVGSHYHFYEVNRGLSFERDLARGMRLDIPAGTSRRFEPGDTREVTLVEFAGEKRITGFQTTRTHAQDEVVPVQSSANTDTVSGQ